MLLRRLITFAMAMSVIQLATFLTVPIAWAGKFLDEMKVENTCGTVYADKLASCTPFKCQKSSPMAMMFGFPPEEDLQKMPPERQKKMRASMAAAEKKMQSMSPTERAAMKAKMVSTLEIKGFDAKGRCQTTTMAIPGQRVDCEFEKPLLAKVANYTRLAATADHIQVKSSSHVVNGKMVTEQIDTISGKEMTNPWKEALDKGQCKMMKKDPDSGWVASDQINRMSHFDINLSEHGKHVDGHVQILNAADGKILFDKDVKTSKSMRKINLKPGTFDIKIMSKDPQLAPVWFRGVKLGEANGFKKNVEFYAITGTLKLTVNVDGRPSKGAAVYMTDPDSGKWIYHGVFKHKPVFTFLPASVKFPETLTGRYKVYVTAVPKGFSPANNAKYKSFQITIKNGETVNKTVDFGTATISNGQARGLIPLKLYWSGNRRDNFVTATQKGVQAALAAGYRYARIEACIAAAGTDTSERSLGSQPLKLFWSSARGDNFTTGTVDGENSAIAAGYKFVRTQGFVSSTKKPGTVPLKLYWSPGRQDNFTTATRQGAHDARAAGYLFSRIEGYVYPASKCQ